MSSLNKPTFSQGKCQISFYQKEIKKMDFPKKSDCVGCELGIFEHVKESSLGDVYHVSALGGCAEF